MNNERMDQGQGRVNLPHFAPLIMDRTMFSPTPSTTSPQDPRSIRQQQSSSKQPNDNGRLRVKKACDRCKRQKTKCDGEQPCLTCSRHGHKCEYTTVVPVTTIIDKNKDNKHNLRVHGGNDDDGYVQYLENRVHELENQVKLSVGINSKGSKLNDENFDKNFFTFSRDKYRVMRRYQNILPHELGSVVYESLDDRERKGLIVPRIQFYGWNMNGSHYLKQRRLPKFEQLIDLQTDREMGDWLLDFFMQKINPLFGILHESVFRDQYENYLNNMHTENANGQSTTRLFTSILYLVFAIALRYSENHPELIPGIKSRNYPSLEEKLFDSAYEVVMKLSFEWESFELVQSWILITLYLRTCHRQISSYTSLGIAIRMCKGMGMNLNRIPAVYNKKVYEHVKIKRIFWVVYTWDRIFGFQSGKSFEIGDEIIHMEIPSLDEDFLDDGWLTKPALAMINLAKICGDIQLLTTHGKLTDESMEEISKRLDSWKLWSDKHLKNSKEQKFDQLLIDQVYLTYHDIVLNLHSKVLFKLLDKDIQMNSTTQIQILLLHSNQVLDLFQKIHSRGSLLVPWWLNLVLLFNISLIDVMLINSGLHMTQSYTNFGQSMELLNFLKDKVGMAKECVWALKMLNHMVITRFQKSIACLENIGIDHGSENVNKIKFLQFGKVDDHEVDNDRKTKKKKRKIDDSNAVNPTNSSGDISVDDFSSLAYQSDSSNLSTDDLMSNLKWFDQWVSEFST